MNTEGFEQWHWDYPRHRRCGVCGRFTEFGVPRCYYCKTRFRPLGVSLITLLLILGGALQILGAVVLVLYDPESTAHAYQAVFQSMLGGAAIYVALDFKRGKYWAYVAVIANFAFVLAVVAGAVIAPTELRGFQDPIWSGSLDIVLHIAVAVGFLEVCILAYLLYPRTRKFFQRQVPYRTFVPAPVKQQGDQSMFGPAEALLPDRSAVCSRCGNLFQVQNESLNPELVCPHCSETILKQPASVATTNPVGRPGDQSDTIPLTCPHLNCQKELTVSRDQVGTKIACPHCRNNILISPEERTEFVPAASTKLTTASPGAKSERDADVFGRRIHLASSLAIGLGFCQLSLVGLNAHGIISIKIAPTGLAVLSGFSILAMGMLMLRKFAIAFWISAIVTFFDLVLLAVALAQQFILILRQSPSQSSIWGFVLFCIAVFIAKALFLLCVIDGSRAVRALKKLNRSGAQGADGLNRSSLAQNPTLMTIICAVLVSLTGGGIILWSTARTDYALTPARQGVIYLALKRKAGPLERDSFNVELLCKDQPFHVSVNGRRVGTFTNTQDYLARGLP